MENLDAYENRLRNFSKHKFMRVIEESILRLDQHGEEFLPEYGNIDKEKWDSLEIANMNMPTWMGLMHGVTSFNRWIFKLDYFDEGFIKSEMIYKLARQRIRRFLESIASDEPFLRELRTDVYDSIGRSERCGDMSHDPVYGTAIFYYLTSAGVFGFDLDKADFGVGYGSPKIFLHQNPEKAARLIDHLESRPDSLTIQVIDHETAVLPVNKRKCFIYDPRNPKIVFLEQTMKSDACSVNEEIRELQHLLNKRGVNGEQIESFLKTKPDYFSKETNRDKVFRTAGMDCFQPRPCLVIGKKRNVNEDGWNSMIEQNRSFVNFTGVDDLLRMLSR